MSVLEIRPIDSDVTQIDVVLSSLGVTEYYRLSSDNDWRITLKGPLGTFSYLEVSIDGEVVSSFPISTANQFQTDLRFEIDDTGLNPVAASTHFATAQYAWGVILLLLWISLCWKRS